jgi:ABC-type polysaccharide/polyol phosphate transport system ATPase subunit
VGVRFTFDRHKRVVSPNLGRVRRGVRSHWGLRGIDLAIEPGEGVALIGPSGSGKTSLLRLLAGILTPDEGTLEVRGRVGTLLSVYAGLLMQLTGRENAELLAVLAGLSHRQAVAALEEIKRRSNLGEAFERPVSSYSQGMRGRLGFAVAEQSEPTILLLDEVHEALDHEFREAVAARGEEMRAAGGIVVAAGHDHAALARLCDRAVLLREGSVAADLPFAEGIAAYLEAAEAQAVGTPLAGRDGG